jgi:small conductance mechanosensitive channel
MKFLTAASFLFFLTPVTSSAQPVASLSKIDTRADLPTKESDEQAQTSLENLLKEAGPFPKVTLKVRQGIVLIDGAIEQENQLEFLEKAANRLPTVISVVNRAKAKSRDLFDLSPAVDQTRRMVDRFKRLLPPIVTAAILLIILIFVGKFISGFNRKFWGKRIQNPFLSNTVARISLWPVWVLFFYFILQAAGLSGLATTIIGGTGVLGIVLGLAFKGIAENYLAGLLLAARAPFTKGDLIILDKYKGYVQNLNMRGTTIIDLSGHLLLIPNSTVINSIVENQTANPKIRTEFIISISYSDSIPQAQEVLVSAMKTVRGALEDPAPDALVENFAASGVDLRVRVWFNVKETNEPRFRSRCMSMAKETLLAKGFTIPTDIKEIVFSDALKVRVLESKEEAANAAQEKKDQIIEQAETNLKDSQARQPASEETQADDLMKLADDNPLMKSFHGDPKT